jgi:hypothetical protein
LPELAAADAGRRMARTNREGGAVVGRAEQGRRQVGFRPPLTSVLPLAGILVVWALLFPSEDTWLIVVLLIVVFAVLRLRQLMVLAEDHLEVTVIRTRRIPWSEVREFEPGSTWRGGTQIQTTSGVVHSVSPCSWWGGPAAEADIETLRREARVRR